MDIHGSVKELYEARQRYQILCRTIDGLLMLNKTKQAQELLTEARALGSIRFWVPVFCLIHRGTFEATMDIKDDAVPGNGICGPCAARIDQEVLSEEQHE